MTNTSSSAGEYRPLQAAGRPIDWVNTGFLLTTPLIAVFGTIWYARNYGVTWLEVANFAVLFALTSLSVTAGYHRYYAHRTYECSKAVQLFYLIFGASSAENSVLNWGSDHRYHHRYVDREADPYNIHKGGLYAHIGWILLKDTRDQVRRYDNSPDLLKDPLVMWQHRRYLPLVVAVTFVLPACIGLVEGRPVGGLLWGGFLRAVAVHHTTFFINSLAHLFGSRPYSLKDTARDSWWLAPLTFGEGYHNFHHKFQADYRNGIRWWQFDSTKWFINLLAWSGQASKLKRTPELLILAARLEVEKELLAARFAAANATKDATARMKNRLDAGSRRVLETRRAWLTAKAEYRHRCGGWAADARRRWRGKLAAHEADYEAAMMRWRMNLRVLTRLPQAAATILIAITAASADFTADSLWPRPPRSEAESAYDGYNCGGIAFGLDKVMDAADIEAELRKPGIRSVACAADCAPRELKFWYWDTNTRPSIRFDYDDDGDGKTDRVLGPEVIPTYYHAAAKCQGSAKSWVKDGFDAPFVADPAETGPLAGRVRRVRPTGKGGARTDVFIDAGRPAACFCKLAGEECAP